MMCDLGLGVLYVLFYSVVETFGRVIFFFNRIYIAAKALATKPREVALFRVLAERERQQAWWQYIFHPSTNH